VLEVEVLAEVVVPNALVEREGSAVVVAVVDVWAPSSGATNPTFATSCRRSALRAPSSLAASFSRNWFWTPHGNDLDATGQPPF